MKKNIIPISTRLCANRGDKLFFFNIISNNLFFERGLESVFERIPLARIKSHENYYLVDFTAENFIFFSTGEWMERIPRGSSVILFPDRKMVPLANYWFYHSSPHITISAVIFDNVTTNITYVLAGRLLYPEVKSVRFSEFEYITFKYLVCDCLCVQKIASLSQRSPKTIYSFKNKIEQKIGMSLKLFISLS